jgi:hypothetical protein
MYYVVFTSSCCVNISAQSVIVSLVSVASMAITVWSFNSGHTKLERFLPKNLNTQRKVLNFENWCSGELSKIGHHFSNKVMS